MSSITLPPGFSISSTPLVTVRRIDLLFSTEEVEALYWSAQGRPYKDGGKSIYTHETAYTIPMDTYLDEFIAPLPTASYSTMITSTGGHWALFHFNGTLPASIPRILNLFKVVAKHWADHFQEVVGKVNQECLAVGESCKHPRRRRALIRDFVEGHDNCYSKLDPLTTIEKAPPNVSNWFDMPKFNAVWGVRKNVYGSVMSKMLIMLSTVSPWQETIPRHRPFTYCQARTAASRRGKLPDPPISFINLIFLKHTNGDCLHPMSGVGIIEGWTQYILHYLTKESP